MTFTWDDETTQKAVKLWHERLTAAAIGKKIGTTGSAVVGKARRNQDLFPIRGRIENQSLSKQYMDSERDLRLARYTKYCEDGLDVVEISKIEGLGTSGVWYHLMKFGLSPKHRERKKKSQVIVRFDKATTRSLIVIPQGSAVMLVKGSKYLHMSGQSLTKSASYAWRGTERQAENMARVTDISGLSIVAECSVKGNVA